MVMAWLLWVLLLRRKDVWVQGSGDADNSVFGLPSLPCSTSHSLQVPLQLSLLATIQDFQ